MNSGRKEKVVKNVLAQTSYSVVQTVLSFISRKLFVIYLTQELLGLNGLLTSILGMLSIAELGVGEAINFSLYKPLANDDKEQIKSIMRLYKRLYIIIGFAIMILGIVMIPFLHFFKGIGEAGPMSYVYKIYFIFLIDSFLSYCLAYSRNIISADQKDYIVINTDLISQIIVTVLQTVILITTQNYIAYLIIKVLVTVVRNFYLYKKSFLLFPYLKEKNIAPLSNEYKRKLFENVKALFITRISYYCVSGTDNILLTSFVSLTSVAVYDNYVIILGIINKAFNTIFEKTRSSIGNYLETEESDKIYTLFKRFFFLNFILTSITSIGIFVLCNEVITIWLGNDFVWPMSIVALLVYNNYSRYILQACEAFRGAAGLYSPQPFVKYLSLMEGIVNLIASLFFIVVLKMGIFGVFLGTLVSTFISTAAVPWIVYKFLFKRPLVQYYVIYLKYFCATVLPLSVSYTVFKQLYTGNHWLNIIIGAGSCTIITVLSYVLLFYRTEEFQYYLSLAKDILYKIRFSKKKK